MFVVGVGPQFGDGTGGDEDGDEDGLPEREEEDAFDAKELGHRTITQRYEINVGETNENTYRKGLRSSLTHIQKIARQYKA